MHQTKKGNEWYFGMKVHLGIDVGSGYVHSIIGTPTKVEHPYLIVKNHFGYEDLKNQSYEYLIKESSI